MQRFCGSNASRYATEKISLAPLQLAAPRPFLESAIEQNFPKPAAQKQQSDAASDREMQEALLLSLLTAGTTGLGVGV